MKSIETPLRNTEVNNYEMTCSSRISSGTQSANEDADRHIRDLKEFKMTIVQVESMNSFWAQVKEPEYLQTLESIHNTLNSKQYKFERHSREEVYIGMLVVSLFMSENDGAFYRAKVISTAREYVEVIFIDYGNIERKDYTLIYKMTDELKKIPSQAIQCSLAFARPNPFLSDAEKEKKLDDTILYLDRIRNLKAKVYSVVHNVVRVILINMDHPLYEFDIMTDLVKLKLYERCEESRISKENNEHRMQSSLLIPRDSHNRSKNEWIHLENLDNILKDVEYDENAPMSRWHHFTVTSPVQTGLEGMTRAARNTQIKPDNASINAIILDDNPSLRCSSLLISYKIDINTQTRACRLRESTLFPKINGIVSLCLLAFSPQVELRYSKKTRCYTGALCGLGFDRIEKKPMYVENDIEDVFDTVITNNDIKDINTIRYQLNLLMGNKRTSMGIIQKPTVLKEYQQHLRGLCLKVLKETRETMNETILFEYPHRWNKIPEHHYHPLTVLQKQEFEMRKRNRIFYEPIRTVDFTKIIQ